MFKIKFPDYFFLYFIVAVAFIVSTVSYYHFVIKQDYVVWYEGYCDPRIDKCFVGCEDDACTEEYYYSEIQKYAPDLYRECGNDITDCEDANVCLIGDRKCSVVYCDTEIHGDICESLDQNSDNVEEIDQANLVEDVL